MSSGFEQHLFYSSAGRSLRDRSNLKKPGRFEAEFPSKKEEPYESNLEDVPRRKQHLENSGKITHFFKSTTTSKRIKIENEDADSDLEALDKNPDHDTEKLGTDAGNDYAAMVEKNIQEKMAFLKSLNIPQVKEELTSIVPLKQPQSKGISVKALKENIGTPSPHRTSRRLQRLDPDGQPLKDEPKLKSYQHPNSNDLYKSYIPRLPVTNPLGLTKTCPTNVDTVEQFLNGLSTDLVPHIIDPLMYDKEILRKMKNDEELIAKVVPDRIYSLAVHPSVTRRHLVAAGGKTGYVGIWDVGSSEGQDGVFLFRPCHDSVNCLIFETDSLLCCSYEGTLKKFDLHKGEFHHLYATPDNTMIRCTHFDSLSQYSYVISNSDGSVVSIDTRTPGIKEENNFECHEKPVKTVNVHPLKKDLFLTASNDGTARLWDIRCLKDLTPVAEAKQKRSVNCAYFSPVTGNAFITVSYDDTVRVYDSSNHNFHQVSQIRHDNQVGRWVTPFRGQWIPNQEALFAIGSKNYPRDIGMYCASTGHTEHKLTSDYMGSIVPIIAFHPKLPFVAGGNASGKIFAFKSE